MTFLKGSDFLGQLQCLVRKQSLDCQASQNKGCDLILFHQQSSIFSIIPSRRYYLLCNIVNRAVIATTCRNSNVKKVSPNTAHKPHHALKDEGKRQYNTGANDTTERIISIEINIISDCSSRHGVYCKCCFHRMQK